MFTWSIPNIRRSGQDRFYIICSVLSLNIACFIWFNLTSIVELVNIIVTMAFATLVMFLVGDILLKILFDDNPNVTNVSFRLLSGILTSIAILYIETLVFPFGLKVDGVILGAVVFCISLILRKGNFKKILSGGSLLETGCLVFALVAVTLWCKDLLQPINSSQAVTVIRAWPDVFYHLCEISSFSRSHGLSTIHDVQMSGATIFPYHFAGYILPAYLVSTGGVSVWAAYAGFLVPFGIFLTFLAAYVLVFDIFGETVAVPASLAILLLPDAYQQGFNNPFFSYHWLLQVAPSSGYGIASAAMSFLFIFEACRSKQLWFIAFSYIFLSITLLFKAQIFVAISLPILMYPAIFYPNINMVKRLMCVSFFAIIFAGAVIISQQFSCVPVLRLDGSGLSEFSQIVFRSQENTIVRIALLQILSAISDYKILYGFLFGLILLLLTFGIFPILYGLLFRVLKQRCESAVFLFPVFIVGVYLTMSLGLAMDDRQVGTAEELLHRPFVWAYFVVILWTVAGIYYYYSDKIKKISFCEMRWLLVPAFLMIVPFHFGARIQTMPAWGIGKQELQSCLVNAADFIKSHSEKSDIVQDAKNDPKFILSALTEREPWVIDSSGVRVPEGIPKRLKILALAKAAVTIDQAALLFKQLGIQWFVVGPDSGVKWASDEKSQPIFSCGEYKVFRF